MTLAAPSAPQELGQERVDEWVRRARSSTTGITDLLARLDEPSWSVRREIVAALAALGDEALDALCQSLVRDRQSETRIAALVDTLAASVGDVERNLIALAPGLEPAVLADAVQVLGRRRKVVSLPTLIASLRHPDDNVAVAAIEALGRLGGRAAVDALVDTVQREYFFRTYPAIDVLGRSADPRAVAPLTRLMQRAPYAAAAARALGRTADKSAAVPLVRLLESQASADVRVAALALAELLDVYRSRYGDAGLVVDVMRQHASQVGVSQITAALTTADGSERAALCRVLGALQLMASAPVLSQLLDDADPGVAQAAAAALQQWGAAAQEAVRAALAIGGSHRRRLLLPLLVPTRDTQTVLKCLEDADPSVRALACDTLASIGDASVVARLFEHLSDESQLVAQAAMRAIQSLGAAETEQLAIEAARSPDRNVRRAALRILSYFGNAGAIDVFKAAQHDADARIRDLAITGLGLVEHPSARALLLECVLDPSVAVRTAAVRGLSQLTCDAEVVSALTRALSDSEAWVRYYACQGLGRLGAQLAADEISALLADSAGQVRVAAIESLALIKSPSALSTLTAAATGDDLDLRHAALIGLGVMKDPAAVPVLLAACQAVEASTRLVAVSALSAFESQAARDPVARALRDADERVRAVAIGVLAGWSHADATLVLIDGLSDDALRDHIVSALSTTLAPGRIPGILAALANADDEIAAVLTSVLARVDPQDHTGAVFEALQMPNVAARKAAAGVLGARGTPAALEALNLQAAEDPSEEVRRVCALLLAQ